MNRCFLGLLLFMGPALTLAAEPPKTPSRLPRTLTAWDLMLLNPAPPGMGGTAWFRYMLDDRFEQHCGAKVVEIAPGKFGILGHGWMESRYVHWWRPD